MTTENSKLENDGKRLDEDYIDIIDVLGFLWHAKVFIIAGVILATAAAVGVVNNRKPPVFVTRLPVGLEVAGGVKPEEIAAKFKSLLARKDVRGDLRAKGVGFVAEKPPYELEISSDENTVRLAVSSLTSDASGERALQVAKALADTVRSLNNKAIATSSFSGVNIQPVSDIELKFTQLAAAQALEEAPVKAELFRIELNLAKKSGLPSLTSTITKATSFGEDFLRLFVASESKLTDSEKNQIIREYAQLTGSIRRIQAKYEGSLKKITSALDMSTVGLASVESVYPVPVASEMEYRTLVALGIHEQFQDKRGFFVAFGLMLGAILGLIAYATRRFIKTNWTRLLEIFR